MAPTSMVSGWLAACSVRVTASPSVIRIFALSSGYRSCQRRNDAQQRIIVRMNDDYLQRVLKARVHDVAIESPLDPAPRLSRRLGRQVLLKREDLQPVFSFKLRGAYNKIAHLSATIAARGVICASAGNHAQGVALAARRREVPALIVMPSTTPAIKVQAVRDLDAEVVLHG